MNPYKQQLNSVSETTKEQPRQLRLAIAREALTMVHTAPVGSVRFFHKHWEGQAGQGGYTVTNKAVPVQKCGDYAESCAGLFDAYCAYNTFKPRIRKTRTHNLSHLNCIYVDLDHYGHGVDSLLHGLDCVDMWQRISDTFPNLSKPTIVANSGRGSYLRWDLSEPFSSEAAKWPENMAKWKVLSEDLCELLKGFGADPRATTNPTGVLRIPQSLNSNNGDQVQYFEYGDKITFRSLRAGVTKSENYLKRIEEKTKQYSSSLKKNTIKTDFLFECAELVRTPECLPFQLFEQKKRTHQQRLNHFSLQYKRMADIRAVAKMRGGRFKDHRWRAIYHYAISVGLTTSDHDEILEAVQGFIDECIDNSAQAKSYTAQSASNIICRFSDWHTRSVYDYCPLNFNHQTAIAELGISAEEQTHLETIISKEEKRARNTVNKREKRRVEGMKPRSDYEQERTSKTDEQMHKAAELKLKNWRLKEIAQELGISTRWVKKLIQKAKQDGLLQRAITL